MSKSLFYLNGSAFISCLKIDDDGQFIEVLQDLQVAASAGSDLYEEL